MYERLQVGFSTLREVNTLLAASAGYFARLCSANGRISSAEIDAHQRPLYSLAELSTQVTAAEQLGEHAAALPVNDHPNHKLVQDLALLNMAETIKNVQDTLAYREREFGLVAEPHSGNYLQAAGDFLGEELSASRYARAAEHLLQANGPGADNLSGEYQDLQTTFRRFAAEKIAPVAEGIHREDRDLPEEMIQQVAEMGCFGLSIPTRYGGFADDQQPDHLAMVIVSDELSRASFGTAGSLITRPELLTKALLKGGTEEQKQKWLPLIASGERQAAVAITEPDYGSDVGQIRTMARKVNGGWRLNGSKMWCTFAGRADILVVLARTDPDMSQAHRGLTLFIVEKPPDTGHHFHYAAAGGTLSGRAIATIGYRGMHSFALDLDDVFVPDANVIGGEAGIGRGFYLQMHSFSGSRVQTAARALGIMAAAFGEALTYAGQRFVFGQPLITYPLVRYKLVQMARQLQAGRRLTYFAASELDAGHGAAAAAMAKFYTGKAAERVTREALQIHGGMGYAEEFPISRHFVDARVLSIFEGAEEVLALRVIARGFLENALKKGV